MRLHKEKTLFAFDSFEIGDELFDGSPAKAHVGENFVSGAPAEAHRRETESADLGRVVGAVRHFADERLPSRLSVCAHYVENCREFVERVEREIANESGTVFGRR